MDRKTLIKKTHLDDASFEKIKEAVKKAESKTSGEIAVCLATESSDYSFWELAAAVVTAVVLFVLLLPFSGGIRFFYEKINWLSPEWYLPATLGFSAFIGIFIFFWLFNIPSLDRIVIPKYVQKKTVSRRAFAAFSESGVYCTEKHNGILIFVSYLEREVRIIADKGISDKISSDLWQIIADSLADEIKNDNLTYGYCEAVERCGELLKEHFPIKKNDVNELPDGLVILEE